MAKESRRIPFDEFSDNLVEILDEVIHNNESVFVESQSGEWVEVKAVKSAEPRQQEFTAEDDEAFLSAAGSWSDVDIDEFLKDIYESRRSSRPPVDL
jgi:hypothetical protein